MVQIKTNRNLIEFVIIEQTINEKGLVNMTNEVSTWVVVAFFFDLRAHNEYCTQKYYAMKDVAFIVPKKSYKSVSNIQTIMCNKITAW